MAEQAAEKCRWERKAALSDRSPALRSTVSSFLLGSVKASCAQVWLNLARISHGLLGDE
jgi:hypothetical protein